MEGDPAHASGARRFDARQTSRKISNVHLSRCIWIHDFFWSPKAMSQNALRPREGDLANWCISFGQSSAAASGARIMHEKVGGFRREEKTFSHGSATGFL
jgi:hypothetical protein